MTREKFYCEFAKAPAEMIVNFEKALTSSSEQNPEQFADAGLIDAGERKFKTVVDKTGMGDHIVGYNNHLDQVTSGIYSAFRMKDMLKPKVKVLQ